MENIQTPKPNIASIARAALSDQSPVDTTAGTQTENEHPRDPSSAEILNRILAWQLACLGGRFESRDERVIIWMPTDEAKNLGLIHHLPSLDLKPADGSDAERRETEFVAFFWVDIDAATATAICESERTTTKRSESRFAFVVHSLQIALMLVDYRQSQDDSLCQFTAHVDSSAVTVAEVVESVLAAYSFEGVQAHVAGCHFESRPWMVLTYLNPLGSEIGVELECYDYAAEPLPNNRAAGLRLDYWSPAPIPIESHELNSIRDWYDRTQTGKQNCVNAAEENDRQRNRSDATDRTLLCATAVWCKWATGRIVFENGKREISVEFAGWAADLKNRSLLPPAVQCKATGKLGRRIVSLPDGSISNDNAIAECSVTGERTTLDQLSRCSVSGQLAKIERLWRCPVSSELLLESNAETCMTCGGKTSPSALSDRQCAACRKIVGVENSVAIPLLKNFSDQLASIPLKNQKWSLGSHGSRTVLIGKKLTEQHLIVMESPETAAPRLMAVRRKTRLSRDWLELDL